MSEVRGEKKKTKLEPRWVCGNAIQAILTSGFPTRRQAGVKEYLNRSKIVNSSISGNQPQTKVSSRVEVSSIE